MITVFFIFLVLVKDMNIFYCNFGLSIIWRRYCDGCSKDFEVLEGWKSSGRPVGLISTTPGTCRSSPTHQWSPPNPPRQRAIAESIAKVAAYIHRVVRQAEDRRPLKEMIGVKYVWHTVICISEGYPDLSPVVYQVFTLSP